MRFQLDAGFIPQCQWCNHVDKTVPAASPYWLDASIPGTFRAGRPESRPPDRLHAALPLQRVALPPLGPPPAPQGQGISRVWTPLEIPCPCGGRGLCPQKLDRGVGAALPARAGIQPLAPPPSGDSPGGECTSGGTPLNAAVPHPASFAQALRPALALGRLPSLPLRAAKSKSGSRAVEGCAWFKK